MASTLMHLYTGKQFKDRHAGIKNPAQFYLGCVYPDCINAFGFAPANARWLAHIRAKDIAQWRENNRQFYQTNTGSINEDFLLGYIVHNITDAAYDEHFNNIDRLDWQRFEQEQSTKDWWTAEALPALRNALSEPKIPEINGVSKAHVKSYLQWIITEDRTNPPQEKPIYLTEEVMEELAGIVYETINDFST